MRIISPFKDYYDGAVGFDPDPGVVWKRTPLQLEEINYRRAWTNIGQVKYKYLTSIYQALEGMPLEPSRWAKRGVLAVTGRAYPFYRINLEDSKAFTLYSCDEVIEVLKAEGRAYYLKNLNKLKSSVIEDFIGKSWSKWTSQLFKPGENYFEIAPLPFRELNSPTFLVRETFQGKFIIEVNPSLREYNFAKVVSPWELYQQIETYLGNELVRETLPLPDTTDELKRDYQGFDKMSFKTRKK